MLSYCNTSPTTGLAVRQAGVEDVNNALRSSWLSFSHLIFHLHSTPLSSLSGAPWTWAREIYRQHRERPAGRCAPHSLTKKGPMPVWRPPPGLPEREWTSVNKRQTYTNTPAAIGPTQREECVGDAKQQQQQQGELHARVPLFHPFRGGTVAGGGLKGWAVDKNVNCRRVTAGPGPASMGVNESPSPHIAINTYSTNRQEAAMGKSPNQHFKTTPQQRHQSARIVTCLSALMSSTLQCVFQTASFPLTNVEWCMTSSLTRWGGGRRGEHAERIGRESEVLTAIYSEHARVNSKTMIRRASSFCDLSLNRKLHFHLTFY